MESNKPKQASEILEGVNNVLQTYKRVQIAIQEIYEKKENKVLSESVIVKRITARALPSFSIWDSS